MYLQLNQLDKAIFYFKNATKKDAGDENPDVKALFGHQFAKAYFNIALIFDHLEETKNSLIYYKLAY